MPTTYRIAEVARRSGFTSSTLRYYDEIGLVPAAARTESGYRLYDQRSLDRLAFIDRAKRLGCSLDEITDLVTVWDGGVCGPLQHRLRETVEDHLVDAQRQVTELVTFTGDLQRAKAALTDHTPDGPCDESCGCATPSDPVDTPIAVALTDKPTSDDRPPISCTLAPEETATRRADWQHAVAHVVGRETVDGGIRLTLAPDAPVGDIARLAAAEQGCCTFFSFSLTLDARGPALEVRTPPEGAEVLAAMFGVPR